MRPSRKWFAADAIRIAATTTDQLFIGRSGVLYGWAFEETTAAAGAKFALVDGSSANGQDLVSITLLANESTRDIWGRPGIWVDSGVFLHMFSGSVRGNIYFQTLSEAEALAILGYTQPDSTG